MNNHQNLQAMPLWGQRMPLWVILSLPFISVIIIVTALTGYLSLRNSSATVNQIAEQLLNEINARIEGELTAFFSSPRRLNLNQRNVIQSGFLDTENQAALRTYFWNQVQIYDNVTSIYFGNPQGGLALGGREGADGSLYVMYTDDFVANPLYKYSTDENGQAQNLITTIPTYDARTRAWYQGAVETGEAYWAAPYVLSTGNQLAIAASLPIYDENGELLGVASTDIFLSHIQNFLQQLAIGQSGHAYIVDQQGLLIGSSTDDSPAIQNESGQWTRLAATSSNHSEIATSAHYIESELGGFDQLEQGLRLKVLIEGAVHYLWLSPHHQDDLDWHIVIVIPESDFLGQIHAQNQITLMITILAVLGAIVIGILAALQVSQPLMRLNQAANTIAKGDWSELAPLAGVREVQQLGHSFNKMAVQLQETIEHLEERVEQRTQELAASEARYRAIVQDQTELVCRYSPDKIVTFANEAYCRYFGKSHEEIIGNTFITVIPPDDHYKIQLMMDAWQTGESVFTHEHRMYTGTGEVRWVQWVNRRLAEQGQVMYQAVGRDITERKQLEDELAKALASQREVNALKSHFIATVSHEFRTPLTIISNSNEIIERYIQQIDEQKRQEHHDRIKKQVRRLTSMLEDVLTFNQAESGNLLFNPQALDMVALCQSIIEDFEVSQYEVVTVTFKHNALCQHVYADSRLCHLIFANLISNAIKYSRANGIVKITLDCQEKDILFTVQDEGLGIPQAAQEQLFEPFYRAENTTTTSGTGLGLAIVRQCVLQHRGTISFESQENKGTRFIVHLPNEIPEGK